jgi:hypothetical protein
MQRPRDVTEPAAGKERKAFSARLVSCAFFFFPFFLSVTRTEEEAEYTAVAALCAPISGQGFSHAAQPALALPLRDRHDHALALYTALLYDLRSPHFDQSLDTATPVVARDGG